MDIMSFIDKYLPRKKSKHSIIKTRNVINNDDNDLDLLGDKLSFDGIEAFNLLRTNLSFSFSDDKKCHIVGIVSPIPSTGKSLVSSNLAISIAKDNKKVLLIDADLRLPTIAKKMRLVQKPGLSNILISSENPSDFIQRYNDMVDVIVAGNIPPKPSELLGSARMGEVLRMLSDYYDYIIVDLAPVTVVPDALAVAKYLDGVILLLRKDYDKKTLVDEAIRQLKLSKTNILGVVFNYGMSSHERYGKYKNYSSSN